MREKQNFRAGGAAALLLFAVFAVCVMFVLLNGADVYRHVTQEDQAAYSRRTAVQYIASRVRQAEGPGAVRLVEFGGTEALSLSQELGGERYQTLVYCSGGWLRELFVSADADLARDFAPESGEQLLELEGLSWHLSGGLLTADIIDAGGVCTGITLSLRGTEGGTR